ncbi:MAG: penicillin-binding protein [Clostridia bacterium]|nr:penicillin-binding protein [Clostridia bacterium]
MSGDASVFKRRTRFSAFALGAVCIIFFVILVYSVLSGSGASADVGSDREYEIQIAAARGSIYDRNGKELVVNTKGNSIVFNAAYFPDEQERRNEIIFRLIKLFKANDAEWIDELPIIYDENGQLAFAEDSDAAIAYLEGSDYLDLNVYATARNCFDALVDRYGLEDYTEAQAREIASVCFNMRRNMFSTSRPYVFSTEADNNLAVKIKENSATFPGVDVVIESYRYYADGSVAPHIIGVTGRISAGEYDEQKEKTASDLEAAQTDEERSRISARAYALDDIIGKSGVESAFEDYLRGTPGIKTITVSDGGDVSEKVSVSPESGDSVFLTIDSGLQKVAQASLEKRIYEVTVGESVAAGLPCAGAVVVLDVNNFDVLASASYPTYDLSTYYDDYDKLIADAGTPLWNRAFQSAYAPGSTMKPCVALGALNEGLITPDTTFFCQGTMEVRDTTFVCYNSIAHGTCNLRRALQVSCNIYFYNVARLLGIDKIDEYAKLLGLGDKTGVEISEAAGNRASIAYRESHGGVWNEGDTLQTAIGQSDNLFTPLQLASYCATIANGGKRYTPHVVKSIEKADGSGVVYESEAELACDTQIPEEFYDAVREGMLDVVNYGTVAQTFAPLNVQVAAKTGTSNKSIIVDGNAVYGRNGFLIAYAPYDDPQIAVAVVLENAGSGSLTATVAADIIDYYFNNMNNVDAEQGENSLIY